MARLIIVALAPAQHPTQRHRPGHKQQVCCDNHHQHRDEKEHQRFHRRLADRRQIVCAQKNHQSGEGEEPIALRRLFAHAFTFQQGDRVRQAHPPEVRQQNQHIDAAEQQQHPRHAIRIEQLHRHGVIRVQQVNQRHFNQPGEAQPQQQTASEYQQRRQQRFPQHHAGDISFAHAEDVVQPELLHAPPNQE